MYVTDGEHITEISLTRAAGLPAAGNGRRHNIERAAQERPIRRKVAIGLIT